MNDHQMFALVGFAFCIVILLCSFLFMAMDKRISELEKFKESTIKLRN